VIDEIGKAADLTLGTGDLPTLAARVRAEIDESIASSTENQEVVEALEQQYDAETGNWPQQLPSSDELMDQIEQFLADQGDDQ
jgi:molybdopterin converting factor small subunit